MDANTSTVTPKSVDTLTYSYSLNPIFFRTYVCILLQNMEIDCYQALLFLLFHHKCF